MVLVTLLGIISDDNRFRGFRVPDPLSTILYPRCRPGQCLINPLNITPFLVSSGCHVLSSNGQDNAIGDDGVIAMMEALMRNGRLRTVCLDGNKVRHNLVNGQFVNSFCVWNRAAFFVACHDGDTSAH